MKFGEWVLWEGEWVAVVVYSISLVGIGVDVISAYIPICRHRIESVIYGSDTEIESGVL